uniref:Uncharacterized protein n=1 Tax=Chlamydomonas leiostraca TaxID=1034604 RepID=A0A7S0WJM4_9CHLO
MILQVAVRQVPQGVQGTHFCRRSVRAKLQAADRFGWLWYDRHGVAVVSQAKAHMKAACQSLQRHAGGSRPAGEQTGPCMGCVHACMQRVVHAHAHAWLPLPATAATACLLVWGGLDWMV